MVDRSRKVMLAIRVSEEERTLIERNMRRAGIRSLRAYMVKMAVDGYVINLDLSDVRRMVALLSRCFSNLNQIAKRANETHSIYAEDLQDLQEHYDRLWEQARHILKELAKL